MNLEIIFLYNASPTIDLIMKIMKMENVTFDNFVSNLYYVNFIKESLLLTIDVIKIGSNLSNTM